MTRRVRLGVGLLVMAAVAFLLAATFPAPGCGGGFQHVLGVVCTGREPLVQQDLSGLYAALAVAAVCALPGAILVVSGIGSQARKIVAVAGGAWLAFYAVAFFGPTLLMWVVQQGVHLP